VEGIEVQVCARGPSSKDKGLVVVLPDPVALAAEAAHLVTRKVTLKVAVSQRDDIKYPLKYTPGQIA
jgi:hypothetical protein